MGGPSMSAFTSNHCSDGGNKETGADNPGVIGNAARVNPRVASVVGGQAIFNIIAAVFADTTASTDVEADTHVNCARNLDAMSQINEGAIIKNVDGTTYEPATEADEIEGDMPGAVSFPTWYVAIGSDADGRRGRQDGRARQGPQHGQPRDLDVQVRPSPWGMRLHRRVPIRHWEHWKQHPLRRWPHQVGRQGVARPDGDLRGLR